MEDVDVAYDWGQVIEPAATDVEAGDLSLLDLYAGVIPPAYDWGTLDLLELYAFGIDPAVLTVAPPPPVVEDPDAPPVPPSVLSSRHEVWACRPITHQPIAQFLTAVVKSYGMDWDGGSADITVSAFDPAWVLVADLDAFEVMIGCDGAHVWGGVCNQPISIGDSQVSIPAVNPMVILDQNTLGSVEQPDFYAGAGRFNNGADGWAVLDEPANGYESPLISVTHSTFSPWEGAGCLEVQGVGWFAGPWVSLPGHPGRVRHPQGSAMLRCPSGMMSLETQVQDGSGYVRQDFAQENAAWVDPDRGWQGLVTTKGWLPGGGGRVRIAGYVESEDACHVDFARITWGTLSGSTVPIPLSSYPAIIVGDAQNTSMGGHPYGISVVVDSTVDTKAKLAWAHHDNHPIGNLLAEVAEMYGGPDVWMDERFTIHVAARRGTVRADVMLDENTVLAPSWEHDPGARVNELIGLTEFGSDATRATVGQAQGTAGYNHRQTVSAPAGMQYDTASEWITGLAGTAGLPQRTGSVDVRWSTAKRLKVGDTVRCGLTQGVLGLAGWVRITGITMNPEAMTGTLAFGVDGDL